MCPPHFYPWPHVHFSSPQSRVMTVMTVTSTNDSVSIFKDEKLKPGIYRIQNIVGQTYVDIREHTRELCGRPTTVLEGKGPVSSRPNLFSIVIIIATVAI